MPHLKLSVLGPLQILVADSPATYLESDKARALLAYLAVEAGRPHRRDALAGLLWPDSPESLARGDLRQALYTLRKAIGDPAADSPHLLIGREEIQFNPASDHILDMAVFEAQLAAAAAHAHTDIEMCADCAHRLHQAAAQYRGRFLDQFFLKDSAAFEEWALMHRESLHRRAIEALERLANYHMRRCEYELAATHAQRQLELDPWREEAHRQMMRALAGSGQRSAALAQYETCRRVLADDLGVEPSAETRDLQAQISRGKATARRDEAHPAPAEAVRPLPVPLTPFIGRERELAQLAELLEDDRCRLITLVGPGGMGKTRLVLETAARHGRRFRDGAAFIPLASVGPSAAVLPAFAEALGLALHGASDPARQVVAFLRDKQMLLIVDNVEHLLECANSWVEILRNAPRVKLLLTSREALNVQDEWVFELEGLPVPESPDVEDLQAYAAAALFLQRARRARVGFEWPPADRPAVARLCQLVGGNPLALELAATWVRTLSCAEIVQELEKSLDLLAAPVRDLAERHRSMRAVFDQSWKMLTPAEQQVLARLSVFRGGVRREAAEQAVGASLSLLSALVAKSLVRRLGDGRYSLHELVRQYAAEQLAGDTKEKQLAQERHSIYYLDLLASCHSALQSSRQKDILAELAAEADNLRVAWAWSVACGEISQALRVSRTLWYLIELKNWFAEGETLFRQAAETLRGRAPTREVDDAVNLMLAHSAFFALRCGKNQAAFTALSASAARLSSSADPRAAMYTFSYLGISCWQLGKFDEAREYLRATLAKAEPVGERWCACAAVEFLGIVAHELGEYAEAEHCLEQALSRAHELGDTFLIAHIQSYYCRTLLVLGKFAQAEKSSQQSLALAREIGYRAGQALALDALGQVAYARASHAEARQFYVAGARLCSEIGATLPLTRILCHQGVNSLALGDSKHAQEAFLTALQTARQDDLVASALAALAGIALLLADNKSGELSLEIALYVLEHPVSTKEARNLVAPLRVRLESCLAPEQMQAAGKRARSRTLDEIASWALTGMNTVSPQTFMPSDI